MLAHPKSMPRFASAISIGSMPVYHDPDSNHSSNSGVARVSWKEDERSLAKTDIEEYLLKDLLLRPTGTKVEMRLSRRSAFVLCDRKEDAEKIAVKESAEVAGVAVRFFLVPLSSLKEDYSCSVLVFGMQLSDHEQEATFVSRIRDAQDACDVVLSRDKGDYDVLIINAQMALIFVEKQKKDQLSTLAGFFSFPGVTNECAPSLTAFKMFYIPVKYRSEEALTRVFAQWKPNTVLCDGTAVVTTTDPSAVMGEVRACCESVAGREVSIECPSNLTDKLAANTLHNIKMGSLPRASLAYFGSVPKDQNVSVHVDQDVLHITGPKNACLEYERIVEAASLHTVDSCLAPEVVNFLLTTPAKEDLKELAKSCQCACFELDTPCATRLIIVSELKSKADDCKDKLTMKYTVDSTYSADHAILHTEAKGAWDCMKDCIELNNPGIRILLEGNTVKLVGECRDITSIKQTVQDHISQLLVDDLMMELSKDQFEVMMHSSKWCDVERQLDCKVFKQQSADPKGGVCVRIQGKLENAQKILDRITEFQKSLVAKAVYIDRPGIQKIFRSDSCGPMQVSRPSPGCNALITYSSMQPLRDVFCVERGKISKQRVDALVNSSDDALLVRNSKIGADLAAVAGPTLQRECSQYVKDHGPLRRGDVAVTGPGNLQAQCVIHGNVRRYPKSPEESVASLQSVVQNALEECDSRRLQSIAFPAIGIGKLKFPVDVAVETLVSSAFDYLLQNRSSTSIKKVILVGLEERVHTLFLSKIEQRCGVSPASVEPQPNHEDVHPMSGTVPDYPDLKLPTLQLDPPPEETPPMGTPREFYILAESDYHCSQAETELHQRVDEMIQTKVIEDETIKDLPTSFLTAFQANAKAAHVKVMIHHNPTRAELLGPKEDVQHAVSVLEHALVAVANYIIAINKQVSSALQHYHWTYTCGPEGMARSYGPGECYELEKAHQFQCKRVTFKREGSSEQVIVDMERLVEEGAGAAGTIQVHRVQREEGFARPESWEGHDLVVEVKKGSKEFEEVASQFESSVGRRVTIVKIERIQNHQLWQAYQAHKQDTVRVTPAGTPAERMLYHGCPVENVDSINSNGFVTNLAGIRVGHAHGQGIYFARDASYSANEGYSKKDRNGHKHVYCCCVLTGVFKHGRRDMRIPPPMNPSTTQWCHSTVNDEKNPIIFVIYNDNRAYPQHLITFKMQ